MVNEWRSSFLEKLSVIIERFIKVVSRASGLAFVSVVVKKRVAAKAIPSCFAQQFRAGEIAFFFS